MNLPKGYLLQNGKYKLNEVIGQGGFGITYKGIWYTEVKGSLGAMRTEVPVCIKEYFFKDYCVRDPQSDLVKVHSDTGKLLFDKFKEKLIKEAKILSEVHHPYIVNVLEVFEENNTAYIAMEYIAGSSLKDKLAKEGTLPENEVLRYIHQIGDALQFVHQKNILHLDIKPSNIIIDKNNNARLIDFGVSKRYDVGEQETSTTMLTLSKGFASIEQYDNEGMSSFTPCPDIYSLGATIYNLLTGKIPTESILRATRPLVNPREINPAISEKTESVILKAMEIIPANRYQSVAEMMGALTFPKDVENNSVKNNLISTSAENQQDETTLLYTDSSLTVNDNDETIVDIPESVSKEKLSKERKSPVVKIMAVTAGLAVLGSVCGIYYYQKNKPVISKDLVLDKDHIADNKVSTEKSGTNVKAEPIAKKIVNKNVLKKEEPKKKIEKKLEVAGAEKSPLNKNQIEAAKSLKNKKDEVPDVKIEEKNVSLTPSVEETEEFYNRLLASGKKKMKEKDFSGAKNDFTLAKDQKITEEVMRLLFSCDEKIEEINISKRKALYEEKMPFGLFKIVRKKSNNRYGAIDEKGNEKIPCKYLSVGKTDNGRAFEREDNLYDIYASNGSLVTKGATYY